MPEKKTARIFENDLLETLSRSHPVLNTAAGVALAAYCAALVDFQALGLIASAALICVTVFAWTLIEYVVHRFVFHWKPQNPQLAKAFYLVHEYHHDFPNELRHTMFPLAVSLPLAFAAFGTLWLTMPLNAALLVFAVIVLCFTGYDLAHHLHHIPTRFAPTIRRRHMLHHFVDSTTNYGVTSNLWDHVFGTLRAGDVRSGRAKG